MSARILLADDHPLFRRGLRDVVEDGGFVVVAEAADGRTALDAIQEQRPDVVIADISMPHLDGLELIARAGRSAEPPLFSVLTMYDDLAFVRHALDLGARGYLLKESADLEVVACLAQVLRGERYVAEGLAWQDAAAGATLLSAAEERVLGLVGAGHSSRHIADLLCISPRTVDNHRARIARKLGLRGSHALLRYAVARHKDVAGE